MTFRKQHPTSSQLGPSTPTKRPTDLPSRHNRLTFFSRFQRALFPSSSSHLPLWKRVRAFPFISRFTPVCLSHRAHRERVRGSFSAQFDTNTITICSQSDFLLSLWFSYSASILSLRRHCPFRALPRHNLSQSAMPCASSSDQLPDTERKDAYSFSQNC